MHLRQRSRSSKSIRPIEDRQYNRRMNPGDPIYSSLTIRPIRLFSPAAPLSPIFLGARNVVATLRNHSLQ